MGNTNFGINLPDLIIESIIRDGLEFLRQNPGTLDDIFSTLLSNYNARKYGSAELARIKALIAKRNIAVVHSFYEAEAKSPCYSIQLGNENEAKGRAHVGDFEEDVQIPLTGAPLAATVKISGLVPTAYSSLSGKVSVADSVDLSLVDRGFVYTDGSSNEFILQGGLSNIPGNKFFFLEKNLTVNISLPGKIATFLDFEQFERRGDSSDVNILIGCHSKEALLTKYLYVILKYILKSRKKDLIKRYFLNSTFQGSDFTRDLKYQGDMVFTRFFTAIGQVDDTWRSDNVELIDRVEIDAEPDDDDSDPDSGPEDE